MWYVFKDSVSNFLLPVPLIFALESCAVAYISIVELNKGVKISWKKRKDVTGYRLFYIGEPGYLNVFIGLL